MPISPQYYKDLNNFFSWCNLNHIQYNIHSILCPALLSLLSNYILYSPKLSLFYLGDCRHLHLLFVTHFFIIDDCFWIFILWIAKSKCMTLLLWRLTPSSILPIFPASNSKSAINQKQAKISMPLFSPKKWITFPEILRTCWRKTAHWVLC